MKAAETTEGKKDPRVEGSEIQHKPEEPAKRTE
jgi:hypothetical protein